MHLCEVCGCAESFPFNWETQLHNWKVVKDRERPVQIRESEDFDRSDEVYYCALCCQLLGLWVKMMHNRPPTDWVAVTELERILLWLKGGAQVAVQVRRP